MRRAAHTSRRPKPRYPIGAQARLMPRLRRVVKLLIELFTALIESGITLVEAVGVEQAAATVTAVLRAAACAPGPRGR